MQDTISNHLHLIADKYLTKNEFIGYIYCRLQPIDKRYDAELMDAVREVVYALPY
jgi:hypothetical protein